MPCFGGENKAVVCHVVLLDESEIAIQVKVGLRWFELLNNYVFVCNWTNYITVVKNK